MARSAQNEHVTKVKNLKKLHQSRSGGGGKGCLTRHHGRENGHHCSHQWQAVKRAEADPSPYNYPRYAKFCGNDTFLTGQYESGFPYYRKGGRMKRPKPHDWDVGKGRNFQTFTKPWWHNAHHILPNATLADAIAESSKDDPRVQLLIKAGLLKAEYNLNDRHNMIILPMDKEVAHALALPRHVNGREAKIRRGDHPDYNAAVQSKVRKVTDEYAKLVKKSAAYKEKHPQPPDKLTKKKLVAISDQLYEEIVSVGRRVGGKSLDELFGPQSS